jgi:hypothetical protein
MGSLRKTSLLSAILVLCLSATLHAQLKRTSTKTDKFDFGSGGTLSITGAPAGSIRITGTNRNEVEITAEIEVSAANEADLAMLAELTGFVTDESTGRVIILSTGTHNKLGPKDAWKKFPKRLVNSPFRVDYTISVPRYCDLEIDGGKGDLSVSGVEGNMRINFLDVTAKVEVVGGSTTAVFGSGRADFAFGTKGFRSRSASIQMAKGDLTARIPAAASADIEAVILNTGRLENELTGLKPRDRKVAFTDRSVSGRAGVGGALLKFGVGQGTLRLTTLTLPF